MEKSERCVGHRPSKNLYRCRRSVRFTVDSKDKIFASNWTSQFFTCLDSSSYFNVYAGEGPIKETSSSSETLLKMTFGAITDILWDGDLANDLIDHAVLSTAMRSNKPISEGLWLVDHLGPKRGLSLLCGDNLALIVPGTDQRSTHRDGYAIIKGRRHTARLKNAMSICRLSRPALVILESEPLGIRLLDLTTWKVSTIPIAQHPPAFNHDSFYSLHPFPHVTGNPSILLGGSTLRISNSDSIVQLVSETYSRGYQLDLETGDLTMYAQVKHFPSHDFVIPIASSKHTPTFAAVRGSSITEVTFDGRILIPHLNALPASDAWAFVTYHAWDEKRYELASQWPTEEKEWTRPRLSPLDLTFLVDSSIFPGDLAVEHSESGRCWRLPSDLLLNLHPTLNIAKLQTVIYNSLLPEDVIEAFIFRLFNKLLVIRDCLDYHLEYVFPLFWLWQEMGLDSIRTLKSAVLRLDVVDACNALILVWNDDFIKRGEDDVLLQTLATRAKNHFLDNINYLIPLSLHNMRLVLFVQSQPDEPPLAPSLPESTSLLQAGLEQLEIESVSLNFPPMPESLLSPSRPFDFVFSVQPPNDQSFAVVGDMRYMYRYWPWFKRLMHSSLKEARTRTLVMPHWTTPNMVLAILECIHGTLWTKLSLEESITLLEYRREIDLVTSNDKPWAPFGDLISRCKLIISDFINDSSRIDYLATYARLELHVEAESVMDSIVKSSTSFDLANAMQTLSKETLDRLQAKFKASKQEQAM